MPRAGGEADKIGNRYEAIWTIYSLLDVLAGEAQAVTVEPLTGGRGVEFIKELNDGSLEFHSAKRQTTSLTWSLCDLTTVTETGRSILKDLFDRIGEAPANTACFVSKTTANDLEELSRIADVSPDVSSFEARLASQAPLQRQFEKYVLRVEGCVAVCHDRLRRLRVVGLTEPELVRWVEQRIRYQLYHSEGSPLNSSAVCGLLADAIANWLGTRVNRHILLDYLGRHGLCERDWQRDSQVREITERRNGVYTRDVEAELIHGASITRQETETVIEALTDGSQRDVVIVGAAGLGKSCTIAQILHQLASRGIPHLTLRLDLQTTVLSADALGRELGFPTSPAIVLAGIANGGPCVLVIDQLDALSSASGRNQHLWTVFEELLTESRRYPRMRVLLACREFDANHDHRLMRLLSNERHCQQITLSLLSIPHVRSAVSRARVDPDSLTSEDLALLQLPQNLSLFLQSGPTEHGRVGSLQSLLDRYWNHKQQLVEQRLGRASRWLEIVRTLSSWLSEHQTLSAPRDILDAYDPDVRAMASEHVLTLEEQTCRFFHESVFDYCFARTHVSSGGSATELLLDGTGEQHLFRRAQVRQVLTYQRGRDFAAYLADIRRLLSEPRVRTHIKKLVLDWLRSLNDPKATEWQLVQSLAEIAPYSQWWQIVPHGSVPWFDLLLQDRTWHSWLGSAEAPVVDHALWLLSQPSIILHRSERVAGLIEPFLDDSEIWQERLRNFFRFAEFYHSRPMFDLFLSALRSGRFDDTGDRCSYHLHNLPNKAPILAAELLEVIVDRICTHFPTGNPFDQRSTCVNFPGDYCRQLADKEPDEFATRLLPRIAVEVERRALITDSGEHRDEIWAYLSLGFEHDFDDQLLHGVELAMRNLALKNPPKLRSLAAPIIESRSHTLNYLLLSAWTSNPPEFADEFASYVEKNPTRLDIGYGVTGGGGGSGTAAVSRAAISAMAPHCSGWAYDLIETAILDFLDPNERRTPASIGYTQLLLLQSLPMERRSRAATKRFAELTNKFPQVEFAPPRPMEVMSVGSPIPANALEKMTEKQWLSAMKKYNSRRMATARDFSKGSLHELAGALTRETRGNKERFAKLAVRMPDDIRPEYFEAILRGLASAQSESSEEAPPRLGDTMQVNPSSFLGVIRRVHELPQRPCGGTICDSIQGLASLSLPDDVIGMVCDYAIADPDPSEETWRAREGKTPYHGGDALTAGINSVRGKAAWAIGGLLFADHSYWPKVKAAVESLCSDQSIAVRSCAVKCTLALLNIDRDEAVRLFLTLVEDENEVAATGEVDSFLHHGVKTHYSQLRPLLLRMLSHQNDTSRMAAARQITVASFYEDSAKEDLASVLAGHENCRVAAAGVYAYNLRSTRVNAVCRAQLRSLFNDSAKDVRDAASDCFRDLSDEHLTAESELIGAYLRSPAFDDGAWQLVHALDRSTAILPDIVCDLAIRIMDRNAQAGTAPHARRDLHHLPELVLRVYRQTSDEATKTRCLNTIDRMLEEGMSGIESEMGKVER